MESAIVHMGNLGFIPFTIVLGSLFLIILAVILVKPRKSKVTLITMGSICLVASLFVTMTWVGANLFRAFIPQ